MTDGRASKLNWLDVLWLVFLAGLAALPPVREYHKQLILLAIGILQLSEGWIVSRLPRRGTAYIVLLKIALATILIDHTGEVGINSSYYPIFYLPVVTAAEYFGPWATLCWTALASAATADSAFPSLPTSSKSGRCRSGRSAIAMVAGRPRPPVGPVISVVVILRGCATCPSAGSGPVVVGLPGPPQPAPGRAH